MLSLLLLPIIIFSSDVDKKIIGYDYQSKTKYIFATNLVPETSLKLQLNHIATCFMKDNFMPAIKDYRNSIACKKDIVYLKSKGRFLKDHVIEVFKKAIESFLDLKSYVINKISPIDKTCFIDIACKNLSEKIHVVFSNFSLIVEKEYCDYEIPIIDFETLIYKHDKYFNKIFFYLSNDVIEILAKYVKIEVFDFINYFDFFANIQYDMNHFEAVPWDFTLNSINSYETQVRDFFNFLKKQIDEVPQGSKIYLRFHIEPSLLVSEILLFEIGKFIDQTKSEKKDIGESELYNIIDNNVYEAINRRFFDYLFGLKKIYEMGIDSEKNCEIKVFDCDFKYNSMFFIEKIEKVLTSEGVAISKCTYESLKYNMMVLGEYFEKAWARIFYLLDSNSGNIPSSFMFESEFTGKCLQPTEFVAEISQKNVGKIYKELDEYENYHKDVFSKQRSAIESLLLMISLVKEESIDVQAGLKDDLVIYLYNLLSKIKLKGWNIELHFICLLNEFGMMCEIKCNSKDASKFELERSKRQIKEKENALSIYFDIINKLSDEKKFKIQKKESEASKNSCTETFSKYFVSMFDIIQMVEQKIVHRIKIIGVCFDDQEIGTENLMSFISTTDLDCDDTFDSNKVKITSSLNAANKNKIENNEPYNSKQTPSFAKTLLNIESNEEKILTNKLSRKNKVTLRKNMLDSNLKSRCSFDFPDHLDFEAIEDDISSIARQSKNYQSIHSACDTPNTKLMKKNNKKTKTQKSRSKKESKSVSMQNLSINFVKNVSGCAEKNHTVSTKKNSTKNENNDSNVFKVDQSIKQATEKITDFESVPVSSDDLPIMVTAENIKTDENTLNKTIKTPSEICIYEVTNKDCDELSRKSNSNTDIEDNDSQNKKNNLLKKMPKQTKKIFDKPDKDDSIFQNCGKRINTANKFTINHKKTVEGDKVVPENSHFSTNCDGPIFNTNEKQENNEKVQSVIHNSSMKTQNKIKKGNTDVKSLQKQIIEKKQQPICVEKYKAKIITDKVEIKIKRDEKNKISVFDISTVANSNDIDPLQKNNKPQKNMSNSLSSNKDRSEKNGKNFDIERRMNIYIPSRCPNYQKIQVVQQKDLTFGDIVKKKPNLEILNFPQDNVFTSENNPKRDSIDVDRILNIEEFPLLSGNTSETDFKVGSTIFNPSNQKPICGQKKQKLKKLFESSQSHKTKMCVKPNSKINANNNENQSNLTLSEDQFKASAESVIKHNNQLELTKLPNLKKSKDSLQQPILQSDNIFCGYNQLIQKKTEQKINNESRELHVTSCNADIIKNAQEDVIDNGHMCDNYTKIQVSGPTNILLHKQISREHDFFGNSHNLNLERSMINAERDAANTCKYQAQSDDLQPNSIDYKGQLHNTPSDFALDSDPFQMYKTYNTYEKSVSNKEYMQPEKHINKSDIDSRHVFDNFLSVSKTTQPSLIHNKFTSYTDPNAKYNQIHINEQNSNYIFEEETGCYKDSIDEKFKQEYTTQKPIMNEEKYNCVKTSFSNHTNSPVIIPKYPLHINTHIQENNQYQQTISFDSSFYNSMHYNKQTQNNEEPNHSLLFDDVPIHEDTIRYENSQIKSRDQQKNKLVQDRSFMEFFNQQYMMYTNPSIYQQFCATQLAEKIQKNNCVRDRFIQNLNYSPFDINFPKEIVTRKANIGKNMFFCKQPVENNWFHTDYKTDENSKKSYMIQDNTSFDTNSMIQNTAEVKFATEISHIDKIDYSVEKYKCDEENRFNNQKNYSYMSEIPIEEKKSNPISFQSTEKLEYNWKIFNETEKDYSGEIISDQDNEAIDLQHKKMFQNITNTNPNIHFYSSSSVNQNIKKPIKTGQHKCLPIFDGGKRVIQISEDFTIYLEPYPS
ncbi:hypothetical protein EDEG_03550 [Edhazardia aedis USNM 41457]|uniref:Uncharacterized protein n=1 Tax=Edhazardia aedis (strain USNM 41457) TaxID=1003232 RepID=J9DHB6_EDHAE|nr:hypothetical protein EDEG_03550 [Edhazardia aedis USNM 41457]|eukprot:EJW01995.1 hypothetical protein EDEG_03550 [Edhazardia aedis USNM 41457]